MTASAAPAASLYETDFYSWTRGQAAALRNRDVGAIDWDNVIEEIETLGRSERRAWVNTSARVIEHLLKIEYWKGAAESDLRHWMMEIRNWRLQMAAKIQENPVLQAEYGAMLQLAWHRGRTGAIDALVEAGVERGGPPRRKFLRRAWEGRLPRECPWCIEEVAAYDSWPRGRRSRARGPQPDPDVYPLAVARRLNEALGERFPEDRGRERPHGRRR